eukprot:14467573-Ditylum_brightwellii.AAC.1
MDKTTTFYFMETLVYFPLTVALDLGRLDDTSFLVRPGQVAKNPCLIALIHVLGAGLNAVAC